MTASASAAEPDLYGQASDAWRRGEPEAAMRLLEALVERQPDNVSALNTLGLLAIGRRDAEGALRYLDRAAAADPAVPQTWFNRFQALELAGDLEAGLASLDRALAADAYFVPALFKKAELLETLARIPEAASLYRAIAAATPDKRALPEAARRALEHGLQLVRAEDERLAEALRAPLEQVFADHPGADFSRARAYAEHRTGRRKVYVQQPVNGHFPYLPAIEFFAREHFPWLAAVEAQTDAIRRELSSLIEERDSAFRPYVAFEASQPVNQWAELNHSRRWSAWFLWEDGVKNDVN
ncbi:MAG TPA: tetratricopeptide repeat protein, partial [Allosphingosinicella sp.]|nr:tetratricopeptide repeat protein [Allosphingosinicella sp.]